MWHRHTQITYTQHVHIVIGSSGQQLKLDKADSVDRKTSLQINSLPERGRCGQWAVEWAWLKWLAKPSEAHSTQKRGRRGSEL